jgi:hypothetical protein
MLPTPEAGEGREYVEKPPPEEPPTFLQEGTGRRSRSASEEFTVEETV